MRCAYLIQSHGSPPPTARLVRAIRSGAPHSRVVVVHDARGAGAGDLAPVRDAGAHVVARTEPVERGRMSLLDPLFAGLDLLLARDASGARVHDFEWLTYLSGQDYPVRPLDAVERDLLASGRDGFMSCWRIGEDGSAGPWKRHQARIRYHAQYARAPAWAAPAVRALRVLGRLPPWRVHLTYGPHVGWRDPRHPFRDGFELWGGIQWWSLRRPVLEHVVAFLAERPDVRRWFARTMVPDEALVQSVVMSARRFDVVPDSRRFVAFEGSRDGRPRTLVSSDFDAITSGAWDFARKFDASVDAAILDRLDREVLGIHQGE